MAEPEGRMRSRIKQVAQSGDVEVNYKGGVDSTTDRMTCFVTIFTTGGWMRTSGTPPTREETTVRPTAAASTMDMQKASVRYAFRKTCP